MIRFHSAPKLSDRLGNFSKSFSCLIFTEIALVIHSIFLYTFEGMIHFQIPETLITNIRLTRVLECRHRYVSSQFCGVVRVCPCGLQATCVTITGCLLQRQPPASQGNVLNQPLHGRWEDTGICLSHSNPSVKN